MQEFAELEKFTPEYLAEFGLRLPTKEDYALARAARARAAAEALLMQPSREEAALRAEYERLLMGDVVDTPDGPMAVCGSGEEEDKRLEKLRELAEQIALFERVRDEALEAIQRKHDAEMGWRR